MKRYNFIKRYYQDVLVFIVKNGKLFSFDLLFCYFKTKEDLEERKISYMVGAPVRCLIYSRVGNRHGKT